MSGFPSGPVGGSGEDRSIRVSVPACLAEEAGAILMDVFGSFEEERQGQTVGDGQEERTVLVFYPPAGGPSTREELLAILPPVFGQPGVLVVETASVPRSWMEGWREHFRPVTIGAVRIRPPWEAPAPPPARDACGRPTEPFIDVVINPGLGFGTGLHPTTRGTLLLLQEGLPQGLEEGQRQEPDSRGRRQGAGAARSGKKELGPLVDVGTGSGILAIAAAKLGWRPVIAFDNDPAALISARDNVAANGVEGAIDLYETDVGQAEERWFRDATVLANMTLEPVSGLLRRLAVPAARPQRVVVSGVLAGSQEGQLMLVAVESHFRAGRRVYEEEWVSLELRPEPFEG